MKLEFILNVLLLWTSHVFSMLLPAPTRLHEQGFNTTVLSFDFGIYIGESAAFEIPYDLQQATENAMSYIRGDFFNRLVVKRGEDDKELLKTAGTLLSLELEIDLEIDPLTSPSKYSDFVILPSIAEEVNKHYDDPSWDESYDLYIPISGSATLRSRTSIGLLRGLQSFVQLIYAIPGSGTVTTAPTLYLLDLPLHVIDAPVFKHRGFMLDTSRHFFTIEDIEHTLAVMSWVKMNVFHWHITDSPSFPLKLDSYRELASKGAYSPRKTYSTAQIQHLNWFANALGISIVLEIDVPGHTASIGAMYPEHMACWDQDDLAWEGKANEPPSGQLRISDLETRKFIKDFMNEAANIMRCPYFSSGGDEVNMECYAQDKRVQSDLNSSNQTIQEALSAFTLDIHSTLREATKTPIVWQEMILTHDLPLENDTIILVWISSKDVQKVVEKNFRVIHAASDYFYLDCGMGGWLGNSSSTSWCDPYKTWQKAYSFDPYSNILPEQQYLILGGEALLWTEQVDSTNLDSIAWPRAAAVAEVFWTGSTLADGALRNSTEFLPRLQEFRYRALDRDVQASPIQPEWCALRPSACNKS